MTPTTLNPIVNPTWTPTVTPKTLIPTAAPTVTPKALFRDACFKRDRDLGSVNSANIARLLVQAVHFFYLYFRVASETSVSPVSPVSPAPPVSPVSPVLPVPPPPLEVAVPSGAAGHVSAGILAQQMGLPITLLGATNANDALCRLLGGRYYFTLNTSNIAEKLWPSCSGVTAGRNGGITPYKAHIDHTLSYPTYIIGSDRQCTPLMP